MKHGVPATSMTQQHQHRISLDITRKPRHPKSKPIVKLRDPNHSFMIFRVVTIWALLGRGELGTNLLSANEIIAGDATYSLVEARVSEENGLRVRWKKNTGERANAPRPSHSRQGSGLSMNKCFGFHEPAQEFVKKTCSILPWNRLQESDRFPGTTLKNLTRSKRR